jgi:hypothetical protein
MEINPHLADQIYKQVGEELAAKQFSSGAMARAVAGANGNKGVAESLYAKFRFEELVRELEREAEREAAVQEQRIKKAIAVDLENSIYTCPNCGNRGQLKIKDGVNVVPFILLMLCGIIPGIIYHMICGYKGVCSNCGKTLVPRVK